MAGPYEFEIVVTSRENGEEIQKTVSVHKDLDYSQLLAVQSVAVKMGEGFRQLGEAWVSQDPNKGKGKGPGKP